MLLDEIGTYIASTSHGLSLSFSSNLFKVPIPETAPDNSVSIIEYGGVQAMRAMGESLSAPVCERPKFQVIVRSTLDGFNTGRGLAESIHRLLDGMADTTLSSVRYLYVRAIQPPFLLGDPEDENARFRFVCNFEAMRATT